MGLDMYLTGRRFFPGYAEKHPRRTQDGFEVKVEELELGYWRKHPNLHGYIVETFANGEDNCQEIGLGSDALKQILAASEADELPTTTGFFFGTSMPEDKPATKEILEKAIAWLEAEDPDAAWRSVIYQASW